jgi:hypothetical protein
MKEKNKKTSDTISKEEAKKKVEELKKNSKASKIEEKQTQKEDFEKLEKNSSKKEHKKILNNIVISFSNLEISLKIFIVILALIFFIILVNKIYIKTESTSLICTYNDFSSDISLNQKLDIEFQGGAIHIFKKTITYTEQNQNWKSVDDIEKEIKEKIEEVKNVKGVTIHYEKDEKTITMMEEYNYYKLSDNYKQKFNLEMNVDLETLKTQYEEFGYTCESSK